MELDLTKPVKTKGGLSVRILTADAAGDFPVAGLVMHEHGVERPAMWRRDGIYYRGSPSDMDLVNVPKKRTLWINIPAGVGTIPCVGLICYTSRELADANAHYSRSTRIACVEVTYTEGEGL